MYRIALLPIILLTACGIGELAPDRFGGDVDGPGFGMNDSNITGFMRGDHATIRNVDDSLSEGYAQIDRTWSYVELHATGDYGWAMLGLNLEGELGRGALAPGSTVYLSGFGIDNGGDNADNDGEQVDGDVIGCSGPDVWDTETDEPAEGAVLTITENPETGDLEITIEADFGDNGVMTGGATVSASTNAR